MDSIKEKATLLIQEINSLRKKADVLKEELNEIEANCPHETKERIQLGGYYKVVCTNCRKFFDFGHVVLDDIKEAEIRKDELELSFEEVKAQLKDFNLDAFEGLPNDPNSYKANYTNTPVINPTIRVTFSEAKDK